MTAKRGRPKVEIDMGRRAMAMRAGGATWAEVEKAIGVSRRTVLRLARAWAKILRVG